MDNEYENNQNEQNIIPGPNQMEPIRINEPNPDSEHTNQTNNDCHFDEDAYDISGCETSGYQQNSYSKSYDADDYGLDDGALKSRYTPVETNWRQELRNDMGIKTAADYAPETKRKSSKWAIWLFVPVLIVFAVLAAYNMGDGEQYDKPINGIYMTDSDIRINFLNGKMLKYLTFGDENECSMSDGRYVAFGTYTLEDSELIMTLTEEVEYETEIAEFEPLTNEVPVQNRKSIDDYVIYFTVREIASDSFVLSINSAQGSKVSGRYKNYILRYSKTD